MSTWIIFVAFGATALGAAAFSAWRASRRIRNSHAVAATIVELKPAEFGAQNFSPVLERNGLRRHVIVIEREGMEITAMVRSYWWREAGEHAQVIYDAALGGYVFAADTYLRSFFFALIGLVAVTIGVLLRTGPFA